FSIEELTFALKTVPEPPYKYSSEKAEPVPGHRVLLNTLAAVIRHSHEISHWFRQLFSAGHSAG
ncbi:TPA: hypothetical protein ACIVL5_001536, partial [Salmonella enterica subsp. diarizonae serovar 61:r:-]